MDALFNLGFAKPNISLPLSFRASTHSPDFFVLLLPGLVRFDALSPTSFPAIGFFRDQLGMQERLKHGVAADGCSPREDARHQTEGESCRQKRKENNVCVFCHPV